MASRRHRRATIGRSTVFALGVGVALLACGSAESGGDTTGTVASVTDPTASDPTKPSTGGDPTTAATSAVEPTEPTQPTGSLSPSPDLVEPAPSNSEIDGTPLDPSSRLVIEAVADLAERLDITADDVTVVESLAVTWGDNSYGCPQPGMVYLQRVVDGAYAVLAANGTEYRYHGGDPLALCESATGKPATQE